MTYSFEKLDVWRHARTLVGMINGTTANFSANERYALTSQLRRASVSVSSNIAEGSARWSARWSKKEKSRYYEMAFGSLMECLNQLILAHDLSFISETELSEIRAHIEMIGRMLNGLYNNP